MDGAVIPPGIHGARPFGFSDSAKPPRVVNASEFFPAATRFQSRMKVLSMENAGVVPFPWLPPSVSFSLCLCQTPSAGPAFAGRSPAET